MKSIKFLASCVILILLSACSKPAENKDPKLHLAELKNQVKDLNTQIKELELQLAASDTSFSFSKSKLVKIDTPQKRDFKHYIEVQGFVDASNNILAAPQMPGVVTSILVKEGDLVSPGKILAQLDGATIRKGMDEVKTGLALANTMYEKQKRLWEQNIGSEAQYLQAKNQKDQLELKMKTLESQLAMTYIKSPIQGTVDQVNLKIGEIASPGFAGIRVVNNKNLKIKAELSDSYIGKIKIGDKVTLNDQSGNLNLESKIIFVGKTINLTRRTFLAEVALPSGSSNFVSNQTLKIKINNGIIKNTYVVSSNLVQRSIQGEQYILVAEESNGNWFAKKRIIEPGIEYNGETQIKSGIQSGDRIITVGYNELVDGQQIAL